MYCPQCRLVIIESTFVFMYCPQCRLVIIESTFVFMYCPQCRLVIIESTFVFMYCPQCRLVIIESTFVFMYCPVGSHLASGVVERSFNSLKPAISPPTELHVFDFNIFKST